MIDVELYRKTHKNFIKQHTERTIEKYLHLLKWKISGENILDIGCGEGTTTVELLESIIASNVSNHKILAVDHDQHMLDSARRMFSQHTHVIFAQMDINEESSWKSFNETFDHIFSINCLHYLRISTWAENLYNLLKPSGQIFLLLVWDNPMVTEFFEMNQQPKWIKYQEHNEKWNTPFIKTRSPIAWATAALKKAGFKNVTCNIVQHGGEMKDKQNAYDFISAFTLIYEHLPKKVSEEYLDEMAENISKKSIVDHDYSMFNYLVVVADK